MEKKRTNNLISAEAAATASEARAQSSGRRKNARDEQT